MAYVITRLCTRRGDCVEVCPVNCIVPGPKDDPDWLYFYIDPGSCIDCGACEPACPDKAIFTLDEVPAQFVADIEMNARFFAPGPGYWDFDLERQRVDQPVPVG